MTQNILFLFTDDQRFDTIGALGNPFVKTPNLDRLVAGGTTFTHAFIAGGSSAAVCMPSRAMLHTGRDLFHIEDQGQAIPAEHTLLGEAFRAAGYTTYATGKWHNGMEAYARSFSCGSEIFVGGMDDHWNVPLCDFDPAGKYSSNQPVCRLPFQTNKTGTRYVDHIHPGRHSTDLFGDAAVDFLHAQDPRHPFLAYVSFMAPHDPRTMPPEYLESYRDVEIPLPPNFLPEHPFDHGEKRVRDELLEEFPRTPDRICQHIREYYAMISHLDFQIGRILDTLDQRGLAQNTIVVLAGDNGLALGQHGLMGKQCLYDHSVRVPLIFHGPGIDAGRRVDSLVFLHDLFSTLCGRTGVPVPDSVMGRDILNDSHPREELYLAYTNCQRALRTRSHKLIEYSVKGERHTQLFDMVNDAWETTDLSVDPAHAQTLDSLRTRLLHLSRETGDAATPRGKEFWAGIWPS